MKILSFAKNSPPIFTENNRFDWISYGEDNIWPNTLLDLSKRSSIHNTILSSKVDYVCGKGLTYKENENENMEDTMVEPNKQYSLDVLFRKISWDYILFGGMAIKVIWSRDRKTISEIYHVPFQNVRCGKKNEFGIIDYYFLSKDWSSRRKSEYTPIQIAAFNDSTKSDFPEQLLYVIDDRPGTEYYPYPSYIGALSYIEADAEIANFHLNNIKNGMMPSYMINFVDGKPSEEEENETVRMFERKYLGTDNAAKLIFTFNDSPELVPKIETLNPSQLDKQFVTLQTAVLQNILIGHKVTSPMLIGIKTEGQLGGATELLNSYKIFKEGIIVPIQEIILAQLNKIYKINGLTEFDIIQSDPINFSFSESVLQNILTVDEMREMIGKEKLETPKKENTNE